MKGKFFGLLLFSLLSVGAAPVGPSRIFERQVPFSKQIEDGKSGY
jgi:hypothetical protein